MLINYVPGEECRIAIVEDGKLEEFYQERASAESHVGNIYKGKVTNIEPSIQAAFVDFGLERNGFLHISDLHPMYFPGADKDELERVGKKTPRRERPPIQKCLKRGQDVLVQVLKEGIGTKGPTLTSYLSIPGRFIVMMPQMDRMGVSRKVEDEEARREMRDLLKELNPPEGYGFIIRTAGMGQTKADLKRDLSYLTRLWKNIDAKMKKTRGVGELFAESDLVIRTIRDVFSSDIDRIVIDDPGAAKRARDFLAIANPRSKSKLVYYNDPAPLFHRFDIEHQIESINARTVVLDSGIELVFDQAEALVAIDVNSGKNRNARDAESNAYQVNKEAVDEVCRQLRLRDLGGVVICDFIDMRDIKHRKKIEAQFRNNLKKDRARTRVNPISQFGILEMTRQRMRPSLQKSIYTECPHCNGQGVVKSAESVVLDVMRRLALVMHHESIARIELTISPDVAFQLLNRKRSHLVSLERRYGKPVMVRVGGGRIDYVHIAAFDERGGALNVETLSSQIPKADKRTFIDVASGDLPEPEPEPVEDDAGEADIEAVMAQAVQEEVQRSEEESEDDKPRKRRRRRRGGRGRRRKSGDEAQDTGEAKAATQEPEEESDSAPEAEAATSPDETAEEKDRDESEPGTRKRRRRRRRSRKSDDASEQTADAAEEPAAKQTPAADPASNNGDGGGQPEPAQEEAAERPRKRRRRSTKKASPAAAKPAATPTDPAPPPTTGAGYSNRLFAGDPSDA